MRKPGLEPPIEDVLSSKGRVKILKVLVAAGELNITEITRRAGLNYAAANRHLLVLRDMELVEEKTFGKIRIFSFKFEDPRAKAIRDLINAWNSTGRR